MDIIRIENFDPIIKLFIQAGLGFLFAMLLTPIYTHFAYKHKWWKKPRTKTTTGETATNFIKLHAKKHERNIPTMAGLIMIVAVALVTVATNLTRSQTYLPLAGFIAAGGVGLLDDYINVSGDGSGVAGLKTKFKFLSILLISILGGLYFYFKLDYYSITVPFVDTFNISWLIIPLFAAVVVSTANAVNISDGLDGLSGGLLSIVFASYSIISLSRGSLGLAAFCACLCGASMAYTWFNIAPARFYMGDAGSFSLGVALGIIAMLTDTVFTLPIIGLVFVIEGASSSLQILSKKLRNGKKIFKIAPIHHHFEAIGWSETKIVGRFWILCATSSLIGITITLMQL